MIMGTVHRTIVGGAAKGVLKFLRRSKAFRKLEKS